MSKLVLSLLIAFSTFKSKPTTLKEEYVYVCVSGTAYAYHNKETCRGLRSCTHTIKKVSYAEAKKMKRKACGYCY